MSTSSHLNSEHHCTCLWSAWKRHLVSKLVFKFQKPSVVFDSPCMRPFTQVSHFYLYMVYFCWECNIVWVFVKSFWSLVGQCFLEVLLFVTLTDLGRECVRITFISKSFCWLIMNFKCSCYILNFNCPSDSVWAFFICWNVNFCWACSSINITLIFRQCFPKNMIISNVYDCCEC